MITRARELGSWCQARTEVRAKRELLNCCAREISHGVNMRFAFAALSLLVASLLLLSGCTGSAPAAPVGNGSANISAAQDEQLPALPQAPEAPPAVVKKNGSAAKPAYVNYCYPTYWKGTLNGTRHNDFYFDRCGDYNYSMEIGVVFTVPFDLAAYLAGKDFNFNDCPGLPSGAANGSRDISIDGHFQSTRTITTPVANSVDKRPDTVATSSGAMYISWPYGLEFATYPRQDAKAAQSGAKKFPHLVADRCTGENIVQTLGYDEAFLSGADAGSFAVSGDMKEITGTWAMNGTVAGNYTLVRTN